MWPLRAVAAGSCGGHHDRTAAAYYTCSSRNGHDAAGCAGADATALQALYGFYVIAESVLAKVIATAQQEFRDAHADRRAELDAVTAQIATAELPSTVTAPALRFLSMLTAAVTATWTDNRLPAAQSIDIGRYRA